MLHLSGCRRNMPFTRGCFLLSRWAGIPSAISSVVADSIHRRIVDHGFVIDVTNVGDIHISNRTVVIEKSIVPASALEAPAKISKPVVDAAIEPHMRSPVAVIKEKRAVDPRPIWWRPEQPNFRSQYPCARDPVIAAVVVPCPVTRRPNVAITGTNGLLVNRQSGRAESHRDPHLPECGRRQDQHYQREQGCTNRLHMHRVFSCRLFRVPFLPYCCRRHE